ncbi:hypothetical protein J8K95_14735 [Bacteroides fragilis]|nr:hypothetical protein [Bacteroides fragilis]
MKKGGHCFSFFMIRLAKPDLKNLYETWTEALSTLKQGSSEVKHRLRSIQSKALRPLFPAATDRNADSIRRERG